MLRILNSQSRAKEDFKPLDPKGRKVTMYTCGPTVYDSFHLGHARFAIVADLVRRYLEFKGYHVRFVMNITDVDDKIIKRALEENRDYRALTGFYIAEFHDLLHLLNCQPADVYPRATDHIPQMLAIVQKLIDRGNAYVASDGDLYFDIASFDRYGELARRNLEEEEAGLSGRLDEKRLAVKRNQGDFVVWKLNKNDKEEIARGGDAVPGWDSPWGLGRPGWHLECSAMSAQYLDVPFDIHAGGQDLLFPHHEDEKAQTECAFCEQLGEARSVRYWIHNGFLQVNQGKMGKSEGNAKWVRDMIQPKGKYPPMAVRMMLLSSHYRSPIEFHLDLLEEATAKLDRLYNALEAIERIAAEKEVPGRAAPELSEAAQRASTAFEEAMDDDFNTAAAMSPLFELITKVNQALAGEKMSAEIKLGLLEIGDTIRGLLSVLGIRPERASAAGSDDQALVDLLMQTRQDVRKAKQFQIADQIRDRLVGLGYEVKDLPDGKWETRRK